MNSLFWVMGQTGGRLVLTLDELANVLGLAKQTIYNQLSDGTLPVPTRKQGKRIIADARDVAEYLDSEREKAKQVHRLVLSRNGSVDDTPSHSGVVQQSRADNLPARGTPEYERLRREKLAEAAANWRADMAQRSGEWAQSKRKPGDLDGT